MALNWTAPSGTVDSYTLKRGTISGGPYPTIVATGPATSASDTTAASGQTYYYVVTATTAGSESANSNQAAATLRPPAPSGLTASRRRWPGDPELDRGQRRRQLQRHALARRQEAATPRSAARRPARPTPIPA